MTMANRLHTKKSMLAQHICSNKDLYHHSNYRIFLTIKRTYIL